MEVKREKLGERKRETEKERERGRENSLMNCKCHVKASVQWRSGKKSKAQNSGSS